MTPALIKDIQKALDILRVYRQDHECTDEDCDECEAVDTAQQILDLEEGAE